MNKKYILKPGNHQFAPGSPAIHTNDNLSDEEAAWYLEKYPHIATLFEKAPEDQKLSAKPETVIIIESEEQSVNEEPVSYSQLNTHNLQPNENLPATN